MPRLWRPAKLCKACRYPNDDCAVFCQKCGKKQIDFQNIGPSSHNDLLGVDIQAIDIRINDLRSSRKSSRYGRQKTKLGLELQSFLLMLDPPKTTLSCEPSDIVRFLVWKERKGRTKIHQEDCPFLGSRVRERCNCPSRLSAGTVDSNIGKLWSIFNELDRAGDYDIHSGAGNPATHFLVKQYLKSIQREQAVARISPKKTTPLFSKSFTSW